MKVIYSFKVFKNHYKPIDDTFFKVAAFSVASASKFYKTKLYCDESSKNLFTQKGIIFDEYEILHEIKNYNGWLYCMPKIHAMIHEDEPYIHLDFDSLIFEKIYSSHTITYGYPEINLTNNSSLEQMDYLNKYYINPYNKYIVDRIEKLVSTQWNLIPNHSFIMVKSPELVREIYTKILKDIPLNVFEMITPMLIEQFLLYMFLLKNKVDIGFLSNLPTYDIIDKLMGSYKFYHFDFYANKNRSDEIDSILKILSNRYNINLNLEQTIF
jgi:hypothetical protein